MKCIKGYEITVLHSFAGYYVGTFCDDGPMCRISGYYKTKRQAEQALENKTFFRHSPEISFCNEGASCYLEKE